MKTSNSMLRVVTCWCLCLSLCSFSIAETPTKLTQDADMYPATEELKSKAQVRDASAPTKETMVSPEALVPITRRGEETPNTSKGIESKGSILEQQKNKYDAVAKPELPNLNERIDLDAVRSEMIESIKSHATVAPKTEKVDPAKETPPAGAIIVPKDVSDVKRIMPISEFSKTRIVLTQEQINERNNLKSGVPFNLGSPANPDVNRAHTFYVDENGNTGRNLVEIGLCTDYWSSESTYEIVDAYGNSSGVQDASWVGDNSCASSWWDLAAGSYTMYLYDSYGDDGLAAAAFDHQTATMVLEWFGGSQYSNPACDGAGACGGWGSSVSSGFAIGDGGCGDGYVYDCSGDGDCCPLGWVGDGLCDGTDQEWGCDLSCIDNDGGDCATDDGGDCSYNAYGYSCDDVIAMGYTCEDIENWIADGWSYDCAGCDNCDDDGSGDCPAPYGVNCDYWTQYGYTCEELEGYGYDCTGCETCEDDGGDCPVLPSGVDCDYWTNYGYTCEQLEYNYGYDCSGCECNSGGDDDCADTYWGYDCNDLQYYGYTCEQLENYGYDCSGCDCEDGGSSCYDEYYGCGYYLNYGYTCDQLENNYGFDCSACYDEGACEDDEPCDDMTVNMFDSYGDGWNGNVLTIGGEVFGADFTTGTSASDCYAGGWDVAVTCDGGSWQSEVYWEILDSAGNLLLSGGAPFDGCLGDCPDPCADVSYPNWVGDGYCDSSNNVDGCWDGGDCCESTCVDATYDCDTYGGCNGECLDPNGNDDACGGDDGDCPDLYGVNCDYWTNYGYTCEELEGYGYDCTGCESCGDDGGDCEVNQYGLTCNDLVYDYGYTCEELLAGWPQNYDCTNCEACEDGFATDDCGSTDCGYYLNYGYSCDELTNYYGFDCSACEAQGGCGGTGESCADTDCGYYLNYGYTCDQLGYYGFDCSACEAEGACEEEDPCSAAGGYPQYMGDGWCDSANNNEDCGYDWGDCCPTDCTWNVDNDCPNNEDYPGCYAGDDYSYCGTCDTCEDPYSQDNADGGACTGDTGGDDDCADHPYYYGDCNYYLNYGYTCEQLENYYGFDCSGCECGDDGDDCADNDYYYGNCDYWTQYGYTCEQLENYYGFDCSGCDSCDDGGDGCADVPYPNWVGDGYCDSSNNVDGCWDGGDCCESTCVDATYDCDTYGGCNGECLDPNGNDDACGEDGCADTSCGYYLNYGYTCEQLEYYGFDCSACEAEGACGDDSDCAYTYYGYNCDYWTQYGYSCEQLEQNYGYDCSGCESCGDGSEWDAEVTGLTAEGNTEYGNGILWDWDDLSDAVECDEGYVNDCADADCCPETWIGDGLCDGEDQEWGCDLSCYDNDGGDCDDATGGGESCADTSCGYYLNYGYTCDQLSNNYGYDCSVCEAEGACSEGASNEECAGTFEFYGADPAGGYGPCWDDGSGYFFFDWDGGCIASAVTYSTNGGDAQTLSLEGYGFNDGFFFYGFMPGDLVEASLTFTDVETDVLAAVSECVAECGDGICSEDEDYYNCPEDCNEPGTCDEGYVLDCADDDCCPESWIGDGYADCEDQAWGCDLTCYDNDGGDCGGSDGGCADTSCGYYLNYGYTCDQLEYYGFDCSVCADEGACGGDSDDDCADHGYYYGDCNYYLDYGYTCEQLEYYYGFDCSGCDCGDDSGSSCEEDCPEGTYFDGWSCYDCSYCLYTYDDSACESPEDCCGMCGGSADGDCGSRSAASAPSLSASNSGVNMKTYDKAIANFKAMTIGMAPNVLTPAKKPHVSDFDRPTMINIETGEIVQGSSNASRDVSYSVHVTCDDCLYGDAYDGYFGSTVSDIIVYGGDYGTEGCGAVSAISTELGTTPESAPACAEWGVVEAECEFFDCEGQCAEGYESWVGDGYCDDGSWGFWFNCDEFDCDGGDCLDECGECNGDGSSCACEPGDVNDDGTSNVQDIVLIVGYILDGEADFDLGCADVNSDGTVNVQDIVVIVNGILDGRTTSDAREVKLNIEDGSVSFNADGFVGAVQMTLSHGVDFTIELTDKAMYAASRTNGNTTTLIVVAPESNELFEASDFVIKEAIFANEDSYATVAMPTELSLSKAYPNPFNPSTSFNVYVPAEGVVDLSVYNVMGQLVDVIHSGNMTAGSHSITWNAFDMTSGVYFVRAESISGASVQKVMLMK